MVQEGWMDEQRLIQGLRARNPRTLETLIAQYSHELFYFIRLVLEGVGSLQDVEECLNDLFVTVWQEFESFNPARGSLRTWLTMRAKYIALDQRRKLMRRHPSGALVMSQLAEQNVGQPLVGIDEVSREGASMSQRMDTNLDTLLEERERREEVRRALERLPDLDRLLVYLRYFQLASFDEIALRTGLSKHAVDTRLWRVRKSLREALREPAHDSPLKRTK